MNNLNKSIRAIKLIILILVFLIIILNGNLGKFINSKLHVYVYLSTYILMLFLFFEAKNIKNNKLKISKIDFIFIIPLIFVFIGYNGDISANIKSNNKMDLSQISEQYNESKTTTDIEENEELKQLEEELEYSEYSKYIEEPIIEKEEKFYSDVIEFNDNNFMKNLEILYVDLEDIIGKKVIMEGYVYRDGVNNENQFAIGKYYMPCCIACMSLIGVLAESENPENFENEKWYRIEATIYQTTDTNKYSNETFDVPLLKITKYQEIQEPKQIYVY